MSMAAVYSICFAILAFGALDQFVARIIRLAIGPSKIRPNEGDAGPE